MLLFTPVLAVAQDTAPATFTKDVAPILQAKCEQCHRPDGGAPFSMLTYQEVRPWARSIKQRVQQRTMPPWHIDARVGTASRFRDDPSLSDDQIATIARWVDAGAPLGNPADMPPIPQFPPAHTWQIGNGTPDVVLAPTTTFTMYAQGSDQWVDYIVDPHLTSDTWIKQMQVMPGNPRIVHHMVVYALSDDKEALASDVGDGGGSFRGRQMLYTYVPGRPPVTYDEGSGVLLKAGTKFRFAFHYAAAGKEESDLTKLGLVFYPKDAPPQHRLQYVYFSVDSEKIDISPGSVSRMDAYYRLQKPTLIESWSPHMHQRGKSQTFEVILPNNKIETLCAVDRFDFGWQIVYRFADDAAPLLPAGSVLHITTTWDNTSANRTNPDPSRWVGLRPGEHGRDGRGLGRCRPARSGRVRRAGGGEKSEAGVDADAHVAAMTWTWACELVPPVTCFAIETHIKR